MYIIAPSPNHFGDLESHYTSMIHVNFYKMIHNTVLWYLMTIEEGWLPPKERKPTNLYWFSYYTPHEDSCQLVVTSNNHIKLIMCLNTPIGVNLGTYVLY